MRPKNKKFARKTGLKKENPKPKFGVPKKIETPIEFNIDDCSSNYKAIKKLGQGATGEVKLVERKSDGSFFAQKRVKMTNSKEKDRALFGELNVLKVADSPYLVKLCSVFQENSMVYMILEYMDLGDLRSLLGKIHRKNIIVEESIIAKLSYSILQGLFYLNNIEIEGSERKGILHRDLKPGNVLINHKGDLKLSDFGMAGVNKEINLTAIGTYLYMSPERFDGREHSFNSDIWSLGLILVELVLQKLPNNISLNDNDDETKNNNNIDIFEIYTMIQSLASNEKLLPNSSLELQDFVGKCLKMDRKERSNASELLTHKFILENMNKGPSIKKWLDEISKKI